MSWPRFDLDAFRDDPNVSDKVYLRIGNALPGVLLVGFHEGRVVAHVRGNSAPWYVTTVYSENGDQGGTCTCEHYLGNQLCKHIGAVMTACNEQAFVSPTSLDALTSELDSATKADLANRVFELAVAHPTFLAVLEGRSPYGEDEDEEELDD